MAQSQKMNTRRFYEGAHNYFKDALKVHPKKVSN